MTTSLAAKPLGVDLVSTNSFGHVPEYNVEEHEKYQTLGMVWVSTFGSRLSRKGCSLLYFDREKRRNDIFFVEEVLNSIRVEYDRVTSKFREYVKRHEVPVVSASNYLLYPTEDILKFMDEFMCELLEEVISRKKFLQ